MTQRTDNHVTLSMLAASIGGALRDKFSAGVWVVAEVSECKVNSSGHCYLSLVEREANGQAPIADIRATIWKSTYHTIAARFRSATGNNIGVGMKLLLHCSVSFHSVYGLSLTINDIDASYTLGESELQRQRTIARLESEGAMGLQREQNSVPLVAQRLAVISSATAAGYEDFCKQIEDSAYRIELTLFEAMMQGEQTTSSIISALDKILSSSKESFDVVVIIRGGGSASDLRWFDSYDLCYYISQYPLPVVTGIGHEKDVSIADLVAFHSFKTPTAVAAAFIGRIARFEDIINRYGQEVEQLAGKLLSEESRRIDDATSALQLHASSLIQQNNLRVERLKRDIPSIAMSIIHTQSSRTVELRTAIVEQCRYVLQSSENRVRNISHVLQNTTVQVINKERLRLERLSSIVPPTAQSVIDRRRNTTQINLDKVLQCAMQTIEGASAKLEHLSEKFTQSVSHRIAGENARLLLLEEQIKSHDSSRILLMGYSLARDQNNRVIRDFAQLSVGDKIQIEMSSGTVHSTVDSINNKS